MLGIGISKQNVADRARRAARPAVAVVLSLAAIAAATETALCQGFDNEWIVGEGGTVNTIAQITGAKFIGGNFDYIGPNTGGAAQLSIASTAPPTGLPHFDGKVHAIAVDPNGGWWIGGEFTRVGTISVTNLVHIDGNGNIAAGWLPNPDGAVLALAADTSFVYVGGSFANIAGGARANFARLTSGTNTANLNSLTANTNGTVRAVLIGLANDAYLGGDFTTVGGNVRERVAQLTLVGTPGLTSWCGGTGNAANGAVHALANDWNGGAVFLGGAFTQFNGTTKNRVCKVQTGGTLSSWGAGANGTVRALAVDVPSKDMFLGGDFTTVEGSNRRHLARVDQTSTGALKPWNPGTEIGATVASLRIFNNLLYVGGNFTELGGLSGYRGLGRVAINGSDNGEADATWKILASNTVEAIAGNSAGTNALFVGGAFKSIGGQRRVNVASLVQNPNSGVWESSANWKPEVGAGSDYVAALTVADSFLFAGGSFGTVTDEFGVHQMNNACKLALSGSGALQSWNPSPDREVKAIMALGGGQVVLGGAFTTAGSATHNNLARVSTSNGAVDSNWNPSVTDANGNAGNTTVNAIINAGSGSIAIGGEFGQVSGSNRVSLAIVDSSGATTSFDAGLSIAGGAVQVHALAQLGSNFFVGGRFDEANVTKSLTRDGRMNVCEVQFSDGTLTSWIAGGSTQYKGVNGTVRALATLSASSAVFLGGEFLQVGPATARTRVARLSSSTGAVSTTWVPAFGPSSVSSDVVNFLFSNGSTVDVGGKFDTTSSSGSTTTPTTFRRSLALANPAQ